MEERLRLVLPVEQFALALELLTEAATAASFTAETALAICSNKKISDPRRTMNDILAILIHDGYLRRDDDRYLFESLLLQDWWRGRFGQGYKSQAAA